MTSKMVSSWSRFHGLSETQHASSRNVIVYDEGNIAALRKWAVVVTGPLNSEGLLDAVTQPDIPIDEWMKRCQPPFQAKTRECTEEYQKYRDLRNSQRTKAYDMMIAWPGVLDSPRILELCENSFGVQRDGRELMLELKRPLAFSSSREQDAIEADLARVHAYASDPDKNPSPLSDDVSAEEVKGFLEAYWLMWQLAEANSPAKPKEFILTACKVLKQIRSLRAHIELKVEAIKSGSVELPTGRAFIDAMAAEARGCLPSQHHLVPARLVYDADGGPHGHRCQQSR